MQKDKRPSIGIPPLTRPQNERTQLTDVEQLDFWRLVLRDADWGTIRIWSHILYYN